MPCGTAHLDAPLRYAWSPRCSGLNSNVRTIPQFIADSEDTIRLRHGKRCSGHVSPWIVKL
jgi:hypothetical protein